MGTFNNAVFSLSDRFIISLHCPSQWFRFSFAAPHPATFAKGNGRWSKLWAIKSASRIPSITTIPLIRVTGGISCSIERIQRIPQRVARLSFLVADMFNIASKKKTIGLQFMGVACKGSIKRPQFSTEWLAAQSIRTAKMIVPNKNLLTIIGQKFFDLGL